MTSHTFALITPSNTHYVDVDRSDGDERSWRGIVLEKGLQDGLVSSEEMNATSVLPAVRPAPPHAHWR
ncbi:MAG: hypothetical protein PSV23_10575 [Brevundimonas sp.]|uniref:hypothetical protein n=1 Tax=Brevundimonas sp. TaxID=1871086 RepID=UPI00248894D4|nr:hypothetical protein [Brevundimonas sp.]MDI1327228.1 hypothetical protein [Brevundimonas sp.]